jgi:hypothetical protein
MDLSRRFAARAWVCLRWTVLGVTLTAALWACNSHRLVAPQPALMRAEQHQFVQALNRKLDLLFMVDNSLSMEKLQDKLSTNLPVLVRGLTALPGGLPDIHIAVVSSSVQPGSLTDVKGCAPGDVDNGAFRHTFNPAGIANHPECNGLTLNGNFIKAEAGAPPNFTGRIEDVFGCIALLGQTGCGFEQQFGSIVLALDPQRPIAANAGFIRDDAYLGIVMLTNEDDCTAPPGTHLFDDPTSTSAGPLGRRVSYRCTEFGITCGGQRPPHTLGPMQTVTETDCASAEASGDLVKDADFEAFLLGLKHGDRGKLLIAAISGPPTPFAVSDYQSISSPSDRADPTAPGLVPSCTSANGSDYADPGVRVAQVVGDLGGVSFNICDEDYSPAMSQIAAALGKLLGPQCLVGDILEDASGAPECTAIEHGVSSAGSPIDTALPYCKTDAAPFPSPCWRLVDSAADCSVGRLFRVCHDPTCAAATTSAGSSSDVTVECAVGL